VRIRDPRPSAVLHDFPQTSQAIGTTGTSTFLVFVATINANRTFLATSYNGGNLSKLPLTSVCREFFKYAAVN
jgi:hypothetical protein